MKKAEGIEESESPISYRSYSHAATLGSHRKQFLSFGIKTDFVHENTRLYIKPILCSCKWKNIFSCVKKQRKEGMKW